MSDGRSNEPRSADQWYSAMKTWTRDRNRLIARAERAESQNQALQEENARLRKLVHADADIDWPDVAKQMFAAEERAEKAEAALREIEAGPYNGFEQCRAIARNALSPTQETDEPDCTRCGNERTVGGYGTDERFPCPVCRPTQETDRVQHNHRERVEGCFRCDLSAQETDPE